MTVLRVAAYELAVIARTRGLWVAAAAFVAAQGLAFAAQVEVLADPRQAAPFGAVLRGYFAGTLLTWALWLGVAAGLATRLVAEDRRTGAWELLLGTPCSIGRAVVGKWLAGWVLLVAAWLPTLAFVAIVRGFAPAEAAWAWGPVVGAYLGVTLVSGALLAVAMGAAAWVRSPLPAGALAAAAGFAILLVGELPAMWPDLARWAPQVAAAVAHASVRARVAALADGDVALATVVGLAGLAAVGLAVCTTWLGRGARRGDAVRRSSASTGLLLVIAFGATVLAHRAGVGVDLSASGHARLAPSTRAALAALDEPARVIVVRPTLASLEPAWREVDAVLARVGSAGAAVVVERADAATSTRLLPLWATSAGLATDDLARVGGLVVELGADRRVLELPALARFGRDALDAPAVVAVDVEAALVAALASLAGARDLEVCVWMDDDPGGWRDVEAALRVGGARVRRGGLLDGCAVAVVAGSAAAWPPGRAAELAAFVRKGGAALVALGRDVPEEARAVLASLGVAVRDAPMIDRTIALDADGRLRVDDGYAAHPINAGFARRRVTVWRPWWALAPDGGEVLVTARAPSPVVVAAAAKPERGRLVVLAVDDLETALPGTAGAVWAGQAIAWLAGRTPPPAGDGDVVVPVRLRLTPAERRTVAIACIGGVPAALLLLGWIARARRRRRR